MAFDFKSMKKNQEALFDSILNKAKKETTTKSYTTDEREWQPTVDKTGNGFAIVRFLPPPPKEDAAFVSFFKHAFKGPNKGWYIENCPTKIGLPCPVCEYNGELWNTGTKSNRAIVSKQKRNLIYKSNVYILSDPAKPENNGQVRIFSFGKKIYEKLEAKMEPKFEGETKLNPFDLWNGANFKIKVRMIADGDGVKRRNYDNSEFDSPAPLLKDEKKLEEIWNSEHALESFIAPDQFKSYDELKVKLDRVLGLANKVQAPVGPVLTPQDVNAENPDFSGSDEPENVEGEPDGTEMFQKLANL